MAGGYIRLGFQSMLGISVVGMIAMAVGVVPKTLLQSTIQSVEKEIRQVISPEKADPPAKARDQEREVASVPTIKLPVAEPPADILGDPETVEKQPVQSPVKSKEVRPAFDVLRVEKDGSVLVAGRTKPEETVDLILEDGTIIGSTKAGPEGDFVVLPKKPLKPGDYSLSLSSTNEKGNVTASSQKGVVQIPKPGEEVLAMISQDGEASRVVAIPSKPTESSNPTVSAPPQELPATPRQSEPSQTHQPGSAAVPQTEPAAAPQTDEDKQVAKLAPPKPPKVEPLEKTPAIKAPSTAPQVVVEAVEVEDKQIYVAGAAERDVPVRIYIDNVPVGVATGTPDNRFLLSKPFDLKPGEHVVRADVIDRKSGRVISRAEVPLVHEVPESKAKAKIPSNSAAEAPEPVDREKQVAALPRIVVPKAVEPVVSPPAVTVPDKTEPVAKSSDAKASQIDAPKTEAKRSVEKIRPGDAETAPAPNTAATEDSPVERTKPATSIPETAITRTDPPKEPDDAAASASKPKIAENEKLIAAVPSVAKPGAPEPIRTGRAIIIKPGDNLWRISRRTYGRGIRYTTIYNANRDQIRDPNRIYIGQIFKIPEKADE